MKQASRVSEIILLLLFFTAAAFSQVPSSGHVFVVVEENHSYSSVIGTSAMPYLNSLASQYGLATQYYANTHPSIGNYFMMTTGQIITNDDSYTATLPQADDNIVRHLLAAGKTWKSYAESLPYVGYIGSDTGYYVKRHNPFAYFYDVDNSSQVNNLVPFSQFASDLANNRLPEFSFIVPNIMDDAHNGTLQQADAWLQQNLAPLLASPVFQQDGLLIVTFDESFTTDTAYGGGHVATVVIGPKVKPGYQSITLYQHQSLLRTVLEALGVTGFPGVASTAPEMAEFFLVSNQPPPPAPTPAPSPAPTPAPAPAPSSFGISVSPSKASAQIGQPLTVNVTVTPQNGFNGAVTLACSGLPASASYTWSSNTVNPTNGAATANLTITMNSLAAGLRPARNLPQPWLALSLPFLGIVAGGAVLPNQEKKKRRAPWLALGLILAIALLGVGCGGGNSNPVSGNPTSGIQNPATAGASYTVTITGTSGALQQSASVVLTLQN